MAEVAVVLMTRDGAATLPQVVDALARQPAHELIAVDSGSRDGTVAILRAAGARVIEVAAEEFDHGATRNLGVESCRAELVVFLVQDAIPTSETWLADLTRPFAANRSLAGTYARQLPRQDAGVITRHYLERWVASSAEGRLQRLDPALGLDALTPAERHRACTFDNVCSCVRRAVWERHRFPATTIAEDVAWAREVLLAGHEIAYVPAAVVRHSHDRSVRYELARTCLLHERLATLFGLRTIPGLLPLARAVGSSLRLHARLLAGASDASVHDWLRAVGLALAWPLGQYLGGRAAARGVPAPRLARV